MKFTTLTIRGRAFDVEVNEDGTFEIQVDGESFRGPTLAQVKKAATAKIGAKPLNIPFIQLNDRDFEDEPKIMRGLVTGIHSGNGNLIVEYQGRTTREQRHNWDRLLRADTDEKKLLDLVRAARQAEKERDEFIEKHILKVKDR